MMEESIVKAVWHEGAKSGHEPELARAYVHFQTFGQLYSPLEGLKKGTIFPELYQPYEKCHRGEHMKHKLI